MASWQSRLADPLLRYYVKPRLTAAMDAGAARRALMNPWRKYLPAPRGVVFTPGGMGGVTGEWAKGANPSGTMLYLHGGGYFACSPQTHRPITGAYARRGVDVFAPAYRLAPEHLFPAAVDDALAAYRGLLESGLDPRRLAIGGDSAGGGLAMATLLAAKAAFLPLPSCAIVFSPWTDLAGTGASIAKNRQTDAMLGGSRLQEVANIYLNGAAAEHPFASPLYGDLADLPPLLIQVGDGEILLDDSTRLAARARDAGVAVELDIWPGLPHVWQITQGLLPEANAALSKSAAFARRHLALATAGTDG